MLRLRTLWRLLAATTTDWVRKASEFATRHGVSVAHHVAQVQDAMPPRRCPVAGSQFGRWVVISPVLGPGRSRVHAECQCVDKTPRVVSVSNLRTGATLSCGCLQREAWQAIVTKHGRAGKEPEYAVWKTMWIRCTNPNDRGYKNYGGRGITICARWRDYANFIGDMGKRPSPKHSINRIDNALGYGPDNCEWATRTDQNRNRRGVKLTMAKAREIRQAASTGELHRVIAARYNIDRQDVSHIATNRSWREN